MRCGNGPENGHAPPNNSHPCCRRLVARRSFPCGRATAIWSGCAAGSGGRILRGDVRRFPPLSEAPSAQCNACIGWPAQRPRCPHRTANRGWRVPPGGERDCACGEPAPTEGQRPSRADGAPEQTAAAPPERAAALFWPDAADDLVGYVLFPKGNDRFWAHGYDSIVAAAFAASDADDR